MVASAVATQALEAESAIEVRCTDGAIFRSAVAETQGRRPSYEDAYAIKPGGRTANFWMFDGHRGDEAAHFAAEAFAAQDFGLKSEELPSNKRIIRAFQAVDKQLRQHLSGLHAEKAGSTALGALAARQRDGTYVAKLVNCGDSRGLIIRAPTDCKERAAKIDVKLPESLEHFSQGWSKDASWLPDWPAVVETIDHKPNSWNERARIEAAGGQVISTGHRARIDGNLAVSRGLGDFDFKSDCRRPAAKQKVSNVPDIYEVHGMPEGTLILLACDGLWDVMGTEEVAEFVQDRLHSEPPMNLSDIAAELVSSSLEAESGDNVTVLLVQLGEAKAAADCSDVSTSDGGESASSDDEKV